MKQHTSTAQSFTLPHTGIVFDNSTTGERAEVTIEGVALYRANNYALEEVVTITRGRALAWALRVRESLATNTYGFLVGSLGLTLEKELNYADYGIFGLPRYEEAAEFAQAAD